LKSSGSKKAVFTSDFIEDISTSQGSFNRLVSVPKFRKYSKIPSLPEPELRVLQLIKSLDQVPSFKDQIGIRLDEQSRAQLSFLFQKYNTSI
jgi:hypothetical protein